MIQDVATKKLKVVPDERGKLMEIMRNDDDIFEVFGQVYLSTTFPGVVKGWHFHREQADKIVCVKGMIKLVLFDERKGSPTKGEVDQFFLGEDNPMLVSVPKGVYHGWKCTSEETAYIINIPDKTYSYTEPDEHRLDPHDNHIPYDWARKDG